jgi:hypothetical protein
MLPRPCSNSSRAPSVLHGRNTFLSSRVCDAIQGIHSHVGHRCLGPLGPSGEMFIKYEPNCCLEQSHQWGHIFDPFVVKKLESSLGPGPPRAQ